MKRHLALQRTGLRLGLIACLLLLLALRAEAQTGRENRDARWVSDHVDLNLLPVAFVVPRGHLAIGGPVDMTPAGFPADTYSLYPPLVYGLTDRTEVALGATGAQRLGPGGEATFYNLGLQQVLTRSAEGLPTLSLGGYGFRGPHGLDGGAAYLVASRQLTRRPYPRGLFAHLGLELQGFSGSDSSAAPRPFVGANYVLNPRVLFSAEFRPRMPWERAHLYSLRTTQLFTRRFGINGGLRNNGYRTHPFIGIQLQ